MGGERINLQCLPTGRPTPTVTWYKDGALVTESGRVQINGWSLSISAAVASDSGVYECRAEQQGTSSIAVSASGVVTVAGECTSI